MPTKLKKIQSVLGLNASMGAMLVMVVLLGMGEKMGERFLPVYLMALGGSAYAVGLLNALDNFLSAIYALAGGYISDKIGYKSALKVYTWISILGYLVIVLLPYWQAVFIGAVLFISWTALSLPAILSLVSQTVSKEKQVMGVSLHSMMRRVPMALGPICGGLLIAQFGIVVGARLAFGAALVLGFVALGFIEKYVQDKRSEDEKTQAQRREKVEVFRQFKAMSPGLKTLLVSDILIRFAEQIPYAFVVVWVIDRLGHSAVTFSLLTAIEMAVALLIYIPVALLSERVSNKALVTITFGFFTLFPLFLSIATTVPLLMIAFVIRGLKEFGEPTRKAMIVKLAPEGAKATTYGTYYLLRDIVVAIASLSAAYLWEVSPQTNFYVASAFGLMGTLLFWFKGDKDVQGL